MKNPQQPKINNMRAEDYKIVFVDSVFGGSQLDHFHATIQSITADANESLSGKPTLNRVDEVTLKMTPNQAKSIWTWLGNHIKEYEENFGEIKTPSELGKILESKAKKGIKESTQLSSGPTGMFG